VVPHPETTRGVPAEVCEPWAGKPMAEAEGTLKSKGLDNYKKRKWVSIYLTNCGRF
jgi:hypothetical protein